MSEKSENLYFPLSGDVSQTINPWTWFFPMSRNQIGLFNINLGNAGNSAMEKKILDDVGSYGRQLGRIGDVLKILVEKLPEDQFTMEEKEAIEALRDQLEDIDRLKKKYL